MPQSALSIGTVNNTTQLPAADLPVDPTWVVEVQPPTAEAGIAPRQKITVADIIGGGGGVAGSGTADTLTKWSASDTVADSSITDDGSTVTVDADLVITGAFTPENVAPTGYGAQSIGVGLTAVGTDRGTALALSHQTNIVATAASAAVGVVLPPSADIPVGGWVDVYNDGPANAFHVYSDGSDTIDGTAGATGKNLTNAFWCRYVKTAANTFVSYRSPITRSA